MNALLGKPPTDISSLIAEAEAAERRARRLIAAHELRALNSRLFGHGDIKTRDRISKCLWRAAGTAGLQRGADGIVRWSGVQTCGSIHACLGCGARIRAARATEIDHLLKSHLAAGRYATLLTFTLPHNRSDDLDMLWSTLMSVYGKVTSGRAIKAIKKMFGIRGFIRSMEVTWTWRNGWHVHLHIAVFHDVELAEHVDEGPNSLEEFRLRFMARWADFVRDELGREMHQVYGVDATLIRDAEGIGDYVSKIHFEMVRGDLKTGSKKSRTPWEIGLDAYNADVHSMALWKEYVTVSKNKRLLAVSTALRDEYGSHGTEDLTDEEIAQQGDEGQLEVEFSAELYDAMRALHRPILADIQLGYQAGGVDAIKATLESRGFCGVIVEAGEDSTTFIRMQEGHAYQVVADIADRAVVRRRAEAGNNPHTVIPPRPQAPTGRDVTGFVARMQPRATRASGSGAWTDRINPDRTASTNHVDQMDEQLAAQRL